MNKQIIISLSLIAALGFFTSGNARAEDTKTTDEQSHEQHHSKDQKAEAPKDEGMMGSMKMDDMKGMMHECMEMHKDGKMCNHQTMQKCEEKMGKGECDKMMKDMKKKTAKNKK